MLDNTPFAPAKPYLSSLLAEKIPVTYAKVSIFDDLSACVVTADAKREFQGVILQPIERPRPPQSITQAANPNSVQATPPPTPLLDMFWNFFLNDTPEHFVPRPDDYDFSRNFAHTPYWVA
jgi:hypothetical protein